MAKDNKSMAAESSAAPAPADNAPVSGETAPVQAGVPVETVIGLMTQMERMMNAVADRLLATPAPAAAAYDSPIPGNDRIAQLIMRAEEAEEKLDQMRRSQGLPQELNRRKYEEGVKKFSDDQRLVRHKAACGGTVYFCRISNLHQVATGRLIGIDENVANRDADYINRMVKTQYEQLIGSNGQMPTSQDVYVDVQKVSPEKVEIAKQISLGKFDHKKVVEMTKADPELGLFASVLG